MSKPMDLPTPPAKRILIIEDDQIIGLLYQNRLASKGFSVSMVTEGQEGFYSIMVNKPDGVLLDLMLPNMNGLDILKKIRAQKLFESIPVIVFSNAYMSGMLEEARQAGATLVFNKSIRSTLDNVVNGFVEILIPDANEIQTGSGSGGPRTEVAPPEPSRNQPAQTSFESKTEAPASPSSQTRFGAIPTRPQKTDAKTSVTSFLVRKPAAIPAAAAPEASIASVSEAQTEQFLSLFFESGQTTMAEIRKNLRAYSKEPDTEAGKKQLHELFRNVHSLSGTAGIASLESLGNFASCVEAFLHALITKPKEFQASTLRTLANAIDLLGLMFDKGVDFDCPMPTDIVTLVVDDDLISQRAIMMCLTRIHLRVQNISEPAQVVDELKNKPYELIFLDVNMPGMDGFELCAEIRKLPQYKKTPIVFITGRTDFQTKAKSITSGGNDFISKPISLYELTVKSLGFIIQGRMKNNAAGA